MAERGCCHKQAPAKGKQLLTGSAAWPRWRYIGLRDSCWRFQATLWEDGACKN